MIKSDGMDVMKKWGQRNVAICRCAIYLLAISLL